VGGIARSGCGGITVDPRALPQLASRPATSTAKCHAAWAAAAPSASAAGSSDSVAVAPKAKVSPCASAAAAALHANPSALADHILATAQMASLCAGLDEDACDEDVLGGLFDPLDLPDLDALPPCPTAFGLLAATAASGSRAAAPAPAPASSTLWARSPTAAASPPPSSLSAGAFCRCDSPASLAGSLAGDDYNDCTLCQGTVTASAGPLSASASTASPAVDDRSAGARSRTLSDLSELLATSPTGKPADKTAAPATAAASMLLPLPLASAAELLEVADEWDMPSSSSLPSPMSGGGGIAAMLARGPSPADAAFSAAHVV